MPKFLCLFYELMYKNFGHLRSLLHKFSDEKNLNFLATEIASACERAWLGAAQNLFEGSKLPKCSRTQIFLFRPVVVFFGRVWIELELVHCPENGHLLISYCVIQVTTPHSIEAFMMFCERNIAASEEHLLLLLNVTCGRDDTEVPHELVGKSGYGPN